MELVGFVGSSHKDRALAFDAQRCVNMFPQISASGTSKSPAKLVSAPGLKVFSDFRQLSNRGVRGAIRFEDNVLFVVAGSKVLRIAANGTATVIGTIPSADTPVSMASNGTLIMFVTGAKGYSIDPMAGTVTEIVDPSFLGADTVGFVTGSFVFNKPNTGQWQAMDPYSVTLDPLWFATAEGSPDNLVGLGVVNQEVWLFGSTTTEIWVNDGSEGFPFSRISGAFIEYGCAAKASIAKIDGSLFWLGLNEDGSGSIYRTSGLQAKRVSNHSLEQEIATYGTVSDAVAYTYEQEGHKFYVLTFPAEDVTWAYDTVTDTWCQRAYLESDGSFSRHRSNCHQFFQRKNIVGDWQVGILYEMSTQIYSDNGNPLVRLRSSPHVAAGGAKMGYSNVEFDIETGVGLQSGQGSDPKVQLRWSDDYGKTFYGARTASVGKVGQYRTRVRFNRLGQARDRVFELSYSEPTPFTIIGARINATQ